MTYFLILCLSAAAWRFKGFYDESVIYLVILFIAWVYVRVFKPGKYSLNGGAWSGWHFYWIFPWMGALMIAVSPKLMYLRPSLGQGYSVFRYAPVGLNLIWRRLLPAGVLLFYLSVLFLSPNPSIDVFRSNVLGVGFLLRGLDPYSQKYPDMYGGQFDYHPGFLYWPGALYLQTLSQLIFRDIRAVLVLAWWAGAFFLPKTNPRLQSMRKLWWFMPFVPYGLEQGWLDPVISLAAAVTLWAMKNRRWWLMAAAIALAASVKQYGFIVGLFPLAALALDREWKTFARVGVIAFLLFLLLLAPFLIWDFRGFLAMTVAGHASAESRADSLNFTAFWRWTTGNTFPAPAQVAMTLYGFAFAGFHLARNRSRNRLAVTAESWAMAFGFAMLFGKFAFCNYYWLLISFLVLSLAFRDSGNGGDGRAAKDKSPTAEPG